MKYMLMIYSNPETVQALGEDLNAVMAEVGELMAELTESGEWLGGEALADPVNAKTVRVRDGVPAVTDGPFVEAKEHLAGYCLLECDSLDRALEIAARWPDARFKGVELRPLMSGSAGEV
jgi:hypothetical protein